MKNENIKDINKLLKNHLTQEKETLINKCNTWYKNINTNNTHISTLSNIIQEEITRVDQIKFIRLRLGHSIITHKHLFDPNTSRNCPLCQSTPVKMEHILDSCPAIAQDKQLLFKNLKATDYLMHPTAENITTIINFLKKANLYKLI